LHQLHAQKANGQQPKLMLMVRFTRIEHGVAISSFVTLDSYITAAQFNKRSGTSGAFLTKNTSTATSPDANPKNNEIPVCNHFSKPHFKAKTGAP
jgi:hypothetical protein